jgi:hypothetical protein
MQKNYFICFKIPEVSNVYRKEIEYKWFDPGWGHIFPFYCDFYNHLNPLDLTQKSASIIY